MRRSLLLQANTLGSQARSILFARAIRLMLALLIAVLATSRVAIAQSAYKLYGINFSPYKDGQSPGIQISPAQIQERLAIVAPYTQWVRTYSSLNGIENTCPIAHQMGLKCAAGAAIYGTPADAQEVNALIALARAGYVDLAIVGTETQHRSISGGSVAVSPATLITYINQVKAAVPGLPVTTADTYQGLLLNPTVLDAVDVIMVNIYPYWEGIPLNNAVSWVNGWYQLMQQAAKGKPAGLRQVILAETGWPDAGYNRGESITSPVNRNSYFLNLVSWARANSVPYFYFEAFDEMWKTGPQEGGQGGPGSHWGIWDTSGALKTGMSDVFNGRTLPDNWGEIAVPGGSTGNPGVRLTYVPATVPGQPTNTLYGRVDNVVPADYKIACYINAFSQWYVKPTAALPLTPIRADGTWNCQVEEGPQVTALAALLFPNGYFPPSQVASLSGLPAVTSVVANRSPYGIRGTVLDSFGNGIDGVTVALTGSQSRQTITSNGGLYSFYDLTSGSTYTVLPLKNGFSFNPTSRTISNITGLQQVDFRTVFQPFDISGQVSTAAGTALGGIKVSLTGGASDVTTTDIFGNYKFPGLLAGGSIVITPAAAGYAFLPSAATISRLANNVVSNFMATSCAYTLNGSSSIVPSLGQTANVSGQANPGCSWTVSSSATWLQASPPSGTGAAPVKYTVFPNFSTRPRTAVLTIGGQPFTVLQEGSPNTPDERFVSLLYFSFLGRLPNMQELSYQVTNGIPSGKAELAFSFFNSPEFNSAGRFVAGLYVGLLARDAEYTGWLFQRNALATGLTSTSILVPAFLNSEEYHLVFGNPTDAQYVTLLYQNILLRDPFPWELSFQVNALRTGQNNRPTMAVGFLDSKEFQLGTGPRLTAFLLYAALLQREVGPLEFSALVQRLSGPNPPILTIIREIITSPEFLSSLN